MSKLTELPGVTQLSEATQLSKIAGPPETTELSNTTELFKTTALSKTTELFKTTELSKLTGLPPQLVLFDGSCHLCNRNMKFLIRNNPSENLMFCAVQSPAGKSILDTLGMPTDHHETMVFINRGQIYYKSNAVIEITRHLAAPWRWLVLIQYMPRNIRDGLYSWVASNRYRISSHLQSCSRSDEVVAKRFIHSLE